MAAAALCAGVMLAAEASCVCGQVNGERGDLREPVEPETILRVGDETGVTPEEMAKITYENGLRLFPKIRP